MRSLACILALLALTPGSVLAQEASELGDPAATPWLPPRSEPDPELVYAAEPDGPSLGGPLALSIVGAITSGAGAITLFAAGIQSADSLEDGSPEVVAIAGTVVTAIGIPLLLAGIYWLIERSDGLRAADDDGAENPLLIRF